MEKTEGPIGRLCDAWNTKNAEAIGVLFAPAAVHEDLTSGVKTHGAAAIRDLFSQTWQAIPDVEVRVIRVIVQGEWLAWEWTMTATHTGDFPDLPATGRSFTLAGSSICRLENGKISNQRDYYDQASFLRQVGALPERT